MQQVITIGADGSVSGLQRKKGQGLDLRQLGDAKIERVSEIKFEEANQKWFVLPVSGAFEGHALTDRLWNKYCAPLDPKADFIGERDGVLYFEDYDDAVKAEVAFLDAARRVGVF